MLSVVQAAIILPNIEPVPSPPQTMMATPNSPPAMASQVLIVGISLNQIRDVRAATNGVRARMKTTLAISVLWTAWMKVTPPIEYAMMMVNPLFPLIRGAVVFFRTLIVSQNAVIASDNKTERQNMTVHVGPSINRNTGVSKVITSAPIRVIKRPFE